MSSSCDGMYKLIRSQDCKGWFAMRVIWRNGNIFADVGILARLPGNACFLWTSSGRQPL